MACSVKQGFGTSGILGSDPNCNVMWLQFITNPVLVVCFGGAIKRVSCKKKRSNSLRQRLEHKNKQHCDVT